MRVLRKRAVRVLLAGAAVSLLTQATCSAAELWLTGIDPVVRRLRDKIKTPGDFDDLFKGDSQWSEAAGHVKVFKVSTQFLQAGTDAELSAMFTWLARHNIALAVEIGFLQRGPSCGKNVEGYTDPGVGKFITERVRKLGGVLGYIALDEQLFYGNLFQGPKGCRYTINTVAQQVAAEVADIRKTFPDVQVGDIEPVGSADPKSAMEKTAQWLSAYKLAAGKPFDFFHADVQWDQSWRPELRLLAATLRSERIAFGVIFDGNGTDQTGVAWDKSAERRFVSIEADPTLRPDQAVIQTWMTVPAHMLPETTPGTMTYLVDRCAAIPTRLTAESRAGKLSGRLTDETGQPLSNASIHLSEVGTDATPITTDRQLLGVVPKSAETALFVARLNMECGCSAMSDVEIGKLTYTDRRTGNEERRAFGLATQNPGNTTYVWRVKMTTPKPAWANTPAFPVIGSHEYKIDVSMSASPQSVGGGYVALLFLNASGKEIRRDKIVLRPGRRALGNVITELSGSFVFPLRGADGSAFEARYDGDATHRPALTQVGLDLPPP